MKPASLKEVERYFGRLQVALNKLCQELGRIQIGSMS